LSKAESNDEKIKLKKAVDEISTHIKNKTKTSVQYQTTMELIKEQLDLRKQMELIQDTFGELFKRFANYEVPI
jgi:hypothetical protein